MQPQARRWYASEEESKNPDFKGQLYTSTNERVERERKDQERFAQAREQQKAAQGNSLWAVPLGK